MTIITKTKEFGQKQRAILRRNTLAYVGLHGLAYDKLVEGIEKNRTARKALIEDLVSKGADVEKLSETWFGKYTDGVKQRHAKRVEFVQGLIPVSARGQVKSLEAELEELTETFEKLSKKAKKTAKKKTKTVKKVAKEVAEVVADKVEDVVEDVKDLFEDVVETPKADVKPAAKADDKTEKLAKAKAAVAKTTAKPAKAEPRHIPYFEDVKRYDPLASEDVVRKIVNHCGIALRSEDAKYVACSDESERATVRDSWLKRKLALEADDAALDKKVLEVCSLMQRDQRKNRVTFYYLLAKKERLLESL